MIEEQYRSSKIEALIMASSEPLAARKIAKVIEEITPSQIARSVAGLNDGYAQAGSSFRIRELAGGYQFYILPEYEGVLESLFARQRKVRLSRAALETVAIIAYRQPTTKTDIEHIRGVASDGVIRNLLEKNMITITGRAETVGKPLQYGTTDEFLKFFGLANIGDLPSMNEIEEMISSAEAKNQTEIEFGVDTDGRMLKLNVADGTFDPERRERLEEGVDDGEPVEVNRQEDESPEEIADEDTTDTGTGEESGDRVSGALILKKGEDNPGSAEADEEAMPAEEPTPAHSGAGENG